LRAGDGIFAIAFAKRCVSMADWLLVSVLLGNPAEDLPNAAPFVVLTAAGNCWNYSR
jgi:hypothetical protein